MFNSIRWSLQLWHAGLLAAVLAGFGSVAYYGIRQAQYEQVDSELGRLAQTVAGGLRGPIGPMDGGFGGPRGRGRGPDRGRGGSPGGAPRQDFGRGRPPDGFGNDPMDRRGPGPGPGRDGFGPSIYPEGVFVDLPPSAAQRFSDETSTAYYRVWGFDGAVLATSGMADDVTDPGPRNIQWAGPPNLQPPEFRQRGELREAVVGGPAGTRIIVGRSILPEQTALRRDVILLIVAGSSVLIIGLAGGWLLSLNVTRPIHAMTQTAQEISASNLSRRIDVAGTHSELGTLATVLNDTFSRLESAFQQQVRFTADASHELRTPLSVIHTNAQLALSRERSAEEYRKTLATCLRASSRMKGLVDSLLLLAGSDAGRLSLDRHLFDLRDLVDDCLAMIAPLAAEKKVAIESDLQSVELSADHSRIAQVVTNLLTNAIRYNRESGRVRVTARADGGDAVLIIEDTGVGITPEHQPHLFERFYRVDVARSRDAGGSGLGLAICKSIIDAHGGQISFESEAGKGTTFTVRLPMDAKS